MDWLSFVIGVLIGWLIEWVIDLFYWRRKYRACTAEKEELQTRLGEAETRLRAYQVEGLQREPERAPHAPVAAEEAAIVPPAARATGGAEGLGSRQAEWPSTAPQAPDDLKLLEGIGPKISQLLADQGILTFAQLSGTSIERLEAILQAGGPSFRLAEPTTWPEQARLAAVGARDELRALQDRLVGGRRTRHQDR